MKRKILFTRTGLLILVVLFVSVLAVAQVVNIASFFGHSPEEIENDFVTVENACDDASNPSNHYKYCQALCPSGYYAMSGSCDTVFDPNVAANSLDSGFQYNFSGALPNLSGWGCFNGSLANTPDEFVKATVVCARAGDLSISPSPQAVCGDYRIEGSEVCDKTNFGDWLDCSDFKTGGGQSLCNGQLQCNSSTNACGSFDISQCVYCNGQNNPCNPPYTLCLDNTCQTDCSGHNGSHPVGTAGQNCMPGQNCAGIPDTYTYPGFCGDNILQVTNGELCDQDCSSYPTFGVVCPDGKSVSSGQTCKDCGCEIDPAPCCKDSFGRPQCRDYQECGLANTEFGLVHGNCVLGCCVYS